MNGLVSVGVNSSVIEQGQGIHHEFIKNAIPDWLSQTSLQRVRDLKNSPKVVPEWVKGAASHEHGALKLAAETGWHAQNAVDKLLDGLQDIHSFAEPLLRKALKDQFGIDEEVRETHLRIYYLVKFPTGKLNVGDAVHSRTVSLLEAAIHNFSRHEELLADSAFISRPDARGHFEKKSINSEITIDQFKALCRKLDIGARYTRHLKKYLLPVDGVAQKTLERKIVSSQKSALATAAHVALMKKDISEAGYLTVRGMLEGSKNLKLDGLPVRFYHLTILDTRLTGIVLIAPDLDAAKADSRRVIAYVPHDPEHPLKEYVSPKAFALELTRQLRDNRPASSASAMSYQQFFSRFVGHGERGHFFAALNAKLSPVTYHGPEWGTNLPAWRETPADNPRLHFNVVLFDEDIEHRFDGDVWVYLFQEQLSKILGDGRRLAISTEDADLSERWEWIDNLGKILADILNAALTVAALFVPVVGELMMGYMIYQFATEVVEGVVDLAEGLYEESAEHLIGCVESLIQLGQFGTGIAIGKEVLLPRLSALIEGSSLVTLPDGEQRLWTQNLDPYRQQNPGLTADSKPDASGLYPHHGKQFLRIDTDHFELGKDPQTGKHRIRHPSRSDAYQPRVESNGDGIFVMEGEQPHAWDDQTLMKRLGWSAEGLEDVYADIRTVSRADAGAIRRMYANNESVIPLLKDTVARFRIDREIHTFIENIGSSRAQDYLKADPLFQFELLDGLWPGEAIELAGADGRVLKVIGRMSSTPVRVSPEGLIDGDLLKTLLSHLDDAEIKTLMNDEFGVPPSAPEVNAKRLRSALARLASERKSSLFDTRYRSIERATTAEAQVIQGQLKNLPGAVAQELVAIATPAERQELGFGRVPERLLNQGRWALQEIRVSRAYEGFYLDSVENTDTIRLALHSLENLPGWNPEVSIELHEYRYGGRQLDRIGNADATIRRTVVENENGTYQPCDEQGNALHSASDFYTSILQALADAERNGLNIHIGEGLKLKEALRDHALKPYRLTKVLADMPALKPATYDPSVMRLRGGNPGAEGELAQLLEIAELCPDFIEAAFHPDIPSLDRYAYIRGLKLIYETCPESYFASLGDALTDASSTGSWDANQQVVNSIESLPDLQKLMLPEQFDALVGRLFTEEGLVPLTEVERNLGANARNLEQTGRTDEYQSLQRAVRENTVQPVEALIELRDGLYGEVMSSLEPVEVSPQVMADLQLAQRAIYRTKELIPLSGNQLPSIWQRGGSAIAKIKGLRQLDLEEGGFTAQLTIAEHARKAIEIKGGNCSENSKVTFSILASQPRTSRIHIVRATEFDHQYVVIGDDLNNPAALVVADSWPEFPAAHTADKGHFTFELPAIETLEPGPAVADYDFIHDTPPGQATLPQVSKENTIRQIKINKLYQKGAYSQFTSLKKPGSTFNVPGEVPVSFEQVPASVIEQRVAAYKEYVEAFKEFLTGQAE